jgi:hypothetical protein
MEVLEDIEVVTNDSKVYRVVANVADNLEVDDDTD